MALGPLKKQILFHRRRANTLTRMATRCHFRAREVGGRALVAKANGFHGHAKHLLERALRLKARATRAAVRARIHFRQIAGLRQARQLYMQRRAG